MNDIIFGCHGELKKRTQAKHKVVVLNPTVSARPGIRTHIKQTDRDKFVPSAPVRHPREKERLQNLLATGHDREKEEEEEEEDGVSPELAPYDEFEDVCSEIEERRQFLDEMRRLGRATRDIEAKIASEVSLRVARLKKIDRERTREFESRRRKL